MEPFTRRVINVIRSIPAGKVMSYGQVAAVAGNPRAARQVARILHSCSEKYDLPWHRVISSRWRVSLEGGGQRERLETEGVVFDHTGRIDPRRYLFNPLY